LQLDGAKLAFANIFCSNAGAMGSGLKPRIERLVLSASETFI
jgi:hypothetical protein